MAAGTVTAMANEGEQVMLSGSELLIQSALAAMRAPRGRAFIHAGGRGMGIRTPGERTYELAPGFKVKISTDASGVATQVEENDKLHAIVRPKPITTLTHRGGHR